jgi:hypothetical protein
MANIGKIQFRPELRVHGAHDLSTSKERRLYATVTVCGRQPDSAMDDPAAADSLGLIREDCSGHHPKKKPLSGRPIDCKACLAILTGEVDTRSPEWFWLFGEDYLPGV